MSAGGRIILLNGDVKSSLIKPGEQAGDTRPPIALCEVHEKEMDDKTPGPLFTEDDRLRLFHVLVTMASQCMGTDMFRDHPCPICAFRDYDFLGGVIQLLEDRKRAASLSQ